MRFAVVSAISVAGPVLAQNPPDVEGEWQDVDSRFMSGEVVEPNTDLAPPVELSPDELEALLLSKRRMREDAIRRAPRTRRSPEDVRGRPDEAVEETEVPAAPELPDGVQSDTRIDAPERLLIGRNKRNTQAQGTLGSTLAEPAAANNGLLVFAAGNFSHAEFSSDGGDSWTNVPLPGGPADAPVLCCDHDVVIDDARRTVFHSALYLRRNAAGDPINGVVRIFVRRPIDSAVATCSYDFDPAGTADDIVPDYPHLGLTKRFLYLSINATGSGGGFARMYRMNLDQLDNCETVDFQTIDQPSSTVGQRVWVPTGGTNNATVMYWAQHNTASQMRIFRWREQDSSAQFFDRTVASTNFTAPDCRGGVGNNNWTRGTASIVGFENRCALAVGAIDGTSALACYWPAGASGSMTQGHIRSAWFQLSDLSLIVEPHIFNQSVCFGFPVVTANKRGDIGISLVYGGRAGGGGLPVLAAVGIDDEFTPGLGVFAGSLVTTAAGVANRADGRFGDYFTIHPYEPCEKWFSATNYAWDGTPPVDSAADVNYRYVEFGRAQSWRCYNAHRDQIPVQ